MGQQQQQQETVASSALKRMVLVLLVAALMAATMAASAMPAFAHSVGGGKGGAGCGDGFCAVGGFNLNKNTGEELGHTIVNEHPSRYSRP
jgi:hypothetical protein